MERVDVGIVQGGLAGVLAKNWWKLLLRGLVAIGFDGLTFTNPGITLAALLAMIGLGAACIGITIALGG
jgi:uncharacterized membrane protein HdeD (DUF308 family)